MLDLSLRLTSPFRFGGGRQQGLTTAFTDYGLVTDATKSLLFDTADFATMRSMRDGDQGAAVDSPVGYMLSKAAMAGAAADAYLAALPNFATPANFANYVSGGAAVSFDGTTLSIAGDGTNSGIAEFVINNVTPGRVIAIEFALASNAVAFRFNTVAGQPGNQAISTGNRKRIEIASAGTHYIQFSRTSAGAAIITGLRIVEMAGGYGKAGSSDSFRPVLKSVPTRLLFDGVDDRLETARLPNVAAGTLAARFITPATIAADSYVIGAADAGPTRNRCFLGVVSANGKLAGGIGSNTVGTITGGPDIRGVESTGVLTWDGSTVKLYLNGAEVYSGAQSGSPTGAQPLWLGCVNAGGAAGFWPGSIRKWQVLDYAVTAAQAANLHTYWSAAA